MEQAVALQADGADILDIGCCSTRPFAVRADEKEELRRLREVLPAVRRAVSVPVSVDTYRPCVARAALEMGAGIINDVSGAFVPEMAAVVRDYRAGWVLTHAGAPEVKTETVLSYPFGVVKDVQRFFDEMLALCEKAGLPLENVCLDPGFGFAKTDEQNIELLKGFGELDTHGAALLAGVSRKRFIGALSGEAPETGRPGGTLTADLEAVRLGADILRVHDVALHRPAVLAADRLYRKL